METKKKKDFTYIYYFVPDEDVQLNRTQSKYIDLDVEDCFEIKLGMRPWTTMRLMDKPRRVVEIFWSLKKDEEKLVVRRLKKKILSTKIEDKEVNSADELEQELLKIEDGGLALIYERQGNPSKFVDFTEDNSVACFFHSSICKDVELIFQHFAEKVGGDNSEQADQMKEFLEDGLEKGMKLPELVNLFEEMVKIPLYCQDEMIRVETGIFNFSGQNRLHFDLTRQIPTGYDDEFYMIEMSIMFPEIELTKEEKRNSIVDLHSDWLETTDCFFEKVREMNLYKRLCKEKFEILEVSITVDET